jgi:integrase/recombinase XerD
METEDAMADDKQLQIVPEIIPARVDVASRQWPRARSDDELVASWLANMKSEQTRSNFATTARRFLAIIAERGLTLRTLTVEDLREAIESLTVGKAPSSEIQLAQRVKSLISYGHRLGYLQFNVGAAVRTTGGTVDRGKRIVGETDIALLIRAAPSKRDRLLIEVGYGGGLRVSELIALTCADTIVRADKEGRVQLSVLGKGNKRRPVLLPLVVSRSLLASRDDAPSSAPIFPSRKGGGPLLRQAVNRMLKRTAAAAGITSDISAHWLRHAHASHALTRGAKLVEVQNTLGHANVATTNTYLRTSPDNSSGLVLDEGVFLQ